MRYGLAALALAAIGALIYFFLLLAVYLSIRFEAKMAAASIIAVIHDIIFTVGVYALFQFEVDVAEDFRALIRRSESLADAVYFEERHKLKGLRCENVSRRGS